VVTSAGHDRQRELEQRLSDAACALALSLGDEQRAKVLAYLALLHRWNSVHNLSAARDLPSLLQNHVLDCMAIIGPLVRHAGAGARRVLDAGTGAGLPAVVLAILLPHWTFTAVDAVGKKIAFVRQVVGELRLENLHPVHARLEAMTTGVGRFDVVVSRAFSSLRQFVELTAPLVEPMGVWLAMKARPSEAELRDLPANCQLFHVERIDVPGMAAQRCLVWLKPTIGSPGVRAA